MKKAPVLRYPVARLSLAYHCLKCGRLLSIIARDAAKGHETISCETTGCEDKNVMLRVPMINVHGERI